MLVQSVFGASFGLGQAPTVIAADYASNGYDDIMNSKVEQGVVKILGAGVGLGAFSRLCATALGVNVSMMDAIAINVPLVATAGLVLNVAKSIYNQPAESQEQAIKA